VRRNPYFGTIQIAACDAPPITDTPFNIVISCDHSGSMSHRARDRKSAWDHCKYTVGRIVSYLKRQTQNIPGFRAFIHITAFNQDITPISVPAEITAETIVSA
jgi:hypothetical protein